MKTLLLSTFLAVVCVALAATSSYAGCNDPFACNYIVTDFDNADCCYDNCLTMVMTEVFNGGWNGSYYYINDLETGDLMSTGTLASGASPTTLNICLPSGCYALYVAGGLYNAILECELLGANEGPIVLENNSFAAFTVGEADCIPGCADPIACNYDSSATVNGSGCVYDCYGCTDSSACNFNSEVALDDGSCVYGLNETVFDAQVVGQNETVVGNTCCGVGEDGTDCVSPGTPYYDLWYVVNSGDLELLYFFLQNIDGTNVSMTIYEDACNGCGELNYIVCCGPVTFGCQGNIGSNFTLLPNTNYYFNVWTTNLAGCGHFQLSFTGVGPGCTDPTACNFDLYATTNDGSCEYPDACNICGGSGTMAGCTDGQACNYDSLANCDDGSCEYTSCAGCTDANACSYDPEATIFDVLQCIYPGDPCDDGNPDTMQDMWTAACNCEGTPIVVGCTIEGACNYDPNANADDGSCEYTSCAGCTDYEACNYDSAATISDDSCLFLDGCGVCGGGGFPDCTDELACNYNPNAGCTDNGLCVYPDCNDPAACNYVPAAACGDDSLCEYPSCDIDNACNYVPGTACVDNDLCTFPGCLDPAACNYDPLAGCSDDSCSYPEETYLDCDGNCLSDSNNDGICDGQTVYGCTVPWACNFNSAATDDDNTCFFATAVYDCFGNCQQDSDGDGICDQNEGQNGAQFCGVGTVWDPATQSCIGFDQCPSDLNNDDVIDTLDLLIFLIGFGTACP
ncbi:MAG: hypothetical protein KDC12_01740 [Flavobacteriales bacterium]|nr:hypothetical protein [Flavobacteriales bacterium]